MVFGPQRLVVVPCSTSVSVEPLPRLSVKVDTIAGRLAATTPLLGAGFDVVDPLNDESANAAPVSGEPTSTTPAVAVIASGRRRIAAAMSGSFWVSPCPPVRPGPVGRFSGVNDGASRK